MTIIDKVSFFLWNSFFSVLEFLLGNIFVPGSYFFVLSEKIYFYFFDFFIRQRSNFNDIYGKKLLNLKTHDWENPKVVGRKRFKMHNDHRSFSNKQKAMNFLRSKNILIESFSNEDIHLLTGEIGHPESSNGWKFMLSPNPSSIPLGWEEYEFKDCEMNNSDWSDIQVPNHWNLQGFDIPIYTNTSYPFQFDPPRVKRNGLFVVTACDLGLGDTSKSPIDRNYKEPGENSTGLYRKKFSLPNNWIQDLIVSKEPSGVTKSNFNFFLVFEGVDSCFSAWMDGTFIGYSQDSCLRSEFDITHVLLNNFGSDLITTTNVEHILAVKVLRWCDGSYLEDQDKWWLSGIYREVYIIRKPSSYIFDFEFSSTLLNDVAEISLSSIVENAENFMKGGTKDHLIKAIRLEIWKDINLTKPELILSSEVEEGSEFLKQKQANKVLNPDSSDLDLNSIPHPVYSSLFGSLKNPILWSAENPFLYSLVLSLHPSLNDANEDTNPIHTTVCQIGIRSCEISQEGKIQLNGVPITIAGINRHEFNPFTGRSVSRESMIEDAKLLKRLNFNAVRCSHYPNDPFWLDVCDTIGLYVIDEANIETHGFQLFGQPSGYLSNLVEWQGAMASRVSRMIERDKTHACIIGWSLGNESGYGKTHKLMAEWVRQRDPSRFVQYESGGSMTDATDVICPMYQRPKWCIDKSIRDSKNRPVVLCEYAHAMGNSGGCLAQYWKVFKDCKYPKIQGGFIWDFADQGLAIPEINGFGYGGDFGDFPNTKQFCCNGILSPDRQPFPIAFEAAYFQSEVEVLLFFDEFGVPFLKVINNRSHIKLDDINLNLSINIVNSIGNIYTLSMGNLVCNDIYPNSSKKIDIKGFFDSQKSLEATDLGIFGIPYRMHQESWIKVVAVKQKAFHSWLDEDIEVYSTTFSDPRLKKFLNIQNDSSFYQNAVSIENSNAFITLFEADPNNIISVRWNNSALINIDKNNGNILSWLNKNGEEVITRPITLCFYRAATDNDRGGANFSYYSTWKKYGIDLLRPIDRPFITSSRIFDEGSAQVFIKTRYVSSKNKEVFIDIELLYLFKITGEVEISSKVSPSRYCPPLPRIGFRFSIPQKYSKCSWFGLGPYESYPDRVSSCYLGKFDSDISKLHTPYTFPQENGRRSNPRWVVFKSPNSNNYIMLSPLGSLPNICEAGVPYCEGWGFSASYYSLETLENTNHNHELQYDEQKNIHVHFDSRTMGIGGYDSWTPNVDKEFLLNSSIKKKTFESKFFIKAI